VNALAQGALRRITQWIDRPTFPLGGGHSAAETVAALNLVFAFPQL